MSPWDEEMLNPSSLDFRIGYDAQVETVRGFELYPGFDKLSRLNPYMLRPNEFLLVSTLESFNLPPHITCEIKLKSSRAREGLSHAMAGWVDNGFHGILTLELKNYSTVHALPIYPGMRVGQLVIFNTDVPTKTYQGGRYAGHDRVLTSLDM